MSESRLQITEILCRQVVNSGDRISRLNTVIGRVTFTSKTVPRGVLVFRDDFGPGRGRSSHERIEVYGGADCLCLAAGGKRHTGERGMPEDGRLGEHPFDSAQGVPFYRWKRKFFGMGVAELRRLRQLEEENRKLKQLVADLALDKVMIQDVPQKKL